MSNVLPDFENLAIRAIKRGCIKGFLLRKVNGGYAKSTVSHMKDVISGVLNKAMDDEIIITNPTYRLGKFIKPKSSKENINPLTSAELKTLLDTVETDFSKHYALFLLLARTGLRIGEALTLKWGDIDFKGRIIDKDNWRRRIFLKALEKAEMRRIRVHDLHHTYATLRISKGDNIANVSNQLGHHSVKLTMDIYYHWVQGRKKSEVDRLDDYEETSVEKYSNQKK